MQSQARGRRPKARGQRHEGLEGATTSINDQPSNFKRQPSTTTDDSHPPSTNGLLSSSGSDYARPPDSVLELVRTSETNFTTIRYEPYDYHDDDTYCHSHPDRLSSEYQLPDRALDMQ